MSSASPLAASSDSTDDVRVLRPRRAAPADALRPTRAEVNLAHLRHNLRVLERTLEARGAGRPAIWGVLKADGYGHGAPAVARTLERAGMPGLCVALLEEAIELRAAGIRAPILVMGGYYGSRNGGVEELFSHDLTPVIYGAEQLESIAAVARSMSRRIGVHLKVDTGMGRLGAARAEVDRLLAALARHREIELAGLMTHLACADDDDLSSTREQLRAFEALRATLASRRLSPRVVHAANSAAMLRVDEAHYDAVRPGVALFGVAPCKDLACEPSLRPVMRVRTEIVAMRTVAAGERIGYGHTWTAPRASRIATIPIGYADGLSRHLSNQGHVLVHGRRAPIVGTVSMDLTTIDVTDVPPARLRDEVVVLGAQEGALGKDAITALELATHMGTIPWEVLTSISRRVPRFYREP